jgi:hypothetical protein
VVFLIIAIIVIKKLAAAKGAVAAASNLASMGVPNGAPVKPTSLSKFLLN